MSEQNRLDVSAKELILDEPVTWADCYGIGPPAPVSVIDSEITTLTAFADKVLRVDGPVPYLLDLEPHSYHDPGVVRKLWYRQVALDYRHRLPVLTVLILLHKGANSPSLTGNYERQLPDGSRTNWYNYRVVRLWEEDPETYLTGGVSLLPLAPLTKVSEANLPVLIDRMAERISPEPKPRAEKLWAATYLLMGVRYRAKLATELLKGVWNMRESSTYQAIIKEGLRKGLRKGRQEGREEGRRAEVRRVLLRQGTLRFGAPDDAVVAAIEAIDDVDRLETLTDRLVDPATGGWNDLLSDS